MGEGFHDRQSHSPPCEYCKSVADLVVDLGNTCAKVREQEGRKTWHVHSCAVVGTVRLFDLLYSGVTVLWQPAVLARAEASPGQAHMLLVRA